MAVDNNEYNKEVILDSIIEILNSVDSFNINMRQYGDEDSLPSLLIRRDSSPSGGSDIRYFSTLNIDGENKFEITISAYERFLSLLRSKNNKFKFKIDISKTDESNRKLVPNSKMIDICFSYGKGEFHSKVLKIFNFFEDKNFYDMNYSSIKRKEAIGKKTKECIDILKNGKGKRVKRSELIENILDKDE